MKMNKDNKMTLAQKARHLASYYGAAVLVVLFAVLCIAFLVKDICKKRPEDAFYVMVIDAELSERDAAAMQEDLSRLLKLDSKTQRCVVEAGYSGGENMQSEAVIAAYMRTGRVDLVIAPEQEFNRYAATGYLYSLDNTELSALKEGAAQEDFFYAQLVDYSKGGAVRELPFHPHEKTKASDCYGIYLQSGPLEGYVAGVMANCQNESFAAAGMRYFLGM